MGELTTLLGYDNFDEQYLKKITPPVLIKTIIIEANSSGPIVVNKNIFSSINNSSYFVGNPIDSLVLKFDDNRGYYAFIKPNEKNKYLINSNDWIVNKSTLFSVHEKDTQKEGDIHIYTITQQDYENAHVLP